MSLFTPYLISIDHPVKLNLMGKLLRLYMGMVLLLLAVGKTAWGQNPTLDSLRHLAMNTTEPDSVVLAWQNLAYESLFVDPDSTEAQGQQSLKLAYEHDLDSLAAEAWLILGFRAMVVGEHDTALARLARAAAIHDKAGRADRVGAVLANQVSIYQRLDQNEKSLEVSLIALAEFEKSRDSMRWAALLGNIANLYVKMYDLESAEQACRSTLAYVRHQESPEARSILYTTYIILGGVFYSRGVYDSAIVYIRNGFEGITNIRDPYSRMSGGNNLGASYEEVGQLDSALQYYRMAYDIASSMQATDRMVIYGSHVVSALSQLKRGEDAHPYLEVVRELIEKTSEPEARQQYYKAESFWAESQSDFHSALRWSQRASDMRDTLLNAERVRALSDLQIRYETEKTERQLAEAEEVLIRRQLWIAVLGGISISLLLAGLVLWLRGKARRRKTLIEEQQRGLNAVIQATESERRRIARDLHDGIGQELGSLMLAFDQLQEEGSRESLKDRLATSISQVRTLSHQMMPRALELAGLAPALEELVQHSFGSTEIDAEYDAFRVPDELDAQVSLVAYRVAQELISNVIRHAEATEVSVQLTANADNLTLTVEDNGRGFVPDPTAPGIGLTNMRTRLKQVKGSLQYESGEEGGTRALVRIPLK